MRLGDSGSGAFDPLIGGRGTESRGLGNSVGAGNGARTEGRAPTRGKNPNTTTSAAGYERARRDGAFHDDDDDNDDDVQDQGNGNRRDNPGLGGASNARPSNLTR